MPYGSKSENSKWTSTWIKQEGTNTSRVVLPAQVRSVYLERSGSNYNARRIKTSTPQKRYRWVKSVSPVPFIKKVRRFSAARNKWITEHIKLYRYSWKKVSIPKSKIAYSSDMLPNNLTYYGERYKDYSPSGSITVLAFGSGWNPKTKPVCTYTGSLSIIAAGPASGWGSGSLDPVTPDSLRASNLPQDFSAIIDKLKAKGVDTIREKVKSQEINLLNVIGERRQTMAMLADTVSRLASAISSARRGNFSKAARKLFPGNTRELANDVLLFNFGIKPFLSDIEGAAKHLAKRQVQSPYVIVKSSNKEVVKKSQYIDTSSANSVISRKVWVHYETEITVRHVMKVKIDDSTTAEAGQLGLLNIPSTLWELTPWSFAIDWLIPIGDWLNKIDAFAGVAITSYHITTVIKQKVTWVCANSGTSGTASYGWLTLGGTGVANKELIYVRREVQPNIPPIPRFPSIRDPITTSRLINAAALLRQLKR